MSTKAEAMADPLSCWNRADPEEPVFVLLGRDPAAPLTIRAWAALRVREGKNKPDDYQIVSALTLADEIEEAQGG